MYQTKKIEEIKEKIQKEIDDLMEKWSPIVVEAIREEMREGDIIRNAMGVSWFEDNRDGENEFLDEIGMLQFSDVFYTSIPLPDKIKK